MRQCEAIKTSNVRVTHHADVLGENTFKTHVLKQEQINLVGTKVLEVVAANRTSRLEDADCTLTCRKNQLPNRIWMVSLHMD